MIGQDELIETTLPFDLEDSVIDAGAGSKYSTVVLRDGMALSSG